MTERPFPDHRAAALALLNGNHRLSRKAGQFLGQLDVDSTPMSEEQAEWVGKLLERAGLPRMGEGGGKRAQIQMPRGSGKSKTRLTLRMPLLTSRGWSSLCQQE